MKKYEFVEHTADAEFYAYGKTQEEAFENAIYAVAEIMVDYKEVKPAIKNKISVQAKDAKALLYSAIEELIFLLDTEDFLLHEIKSLKIEEQNGEMTLDAELTGDEVKNCEPQKAVKAATYNQMEIKQENGKWIVHAVVDI